MLVLAGVRGAQHAQAAGLPGFVVVGDEVAVERQCNLRVFVMSLNV